MLCRQHLPQNRCSHRNWQDDGGYSGSKDKGHSHKAKTVLERTCEIGRKHKRNAAGSKQCNCTCDHCCKNRTAKKDTTFHSQSTFIQRRELPPLSPIHFLSSFYRLASVVTIVSFPDARLRRYPATV